MLHRNILKIINKNYKKNYLQKWRNRSKRTNSMSSILVVFLYGTIDFSWCRRWIWMIRLKVLQETSTVITGLSSSYCQFLINNVCKYEKLISFFFFPNYYQQDATILIYLFPQTLYMFQAVPPPIIRNTQLQVLDEIELTFHLIHASS